MRRKKPLLAAMLVVMAFTLSTWPLAAASDNEDAITPSVVQAIPPKYPAVARAAKVSGEVVVEATVDSSGAVISTSIISGHKLLSNAVEKAANKWKFNPLEQRAKDRKVRLSFQFTLIPGNKGTPDDLGVVFWPPYKVEVRDTPYRVDD
jgi:TonB family protein